MYRQNLRRSIFGRIRRSTFRKNNCEKEGEPKSLYTKFCEIFHLPREPVSKQRLLFFKKEMKSQKEKYLWGYVGSSVCYFVLLIRGWGRLEGKKSSEHLFKLVPKGWGYTKKLIFVFNTKPANEPVEPCIRVEGSKEQSCVFGEVVICVCIIVVRLLGETMWPKATVIISVEDTKIDYLLTHLAFGVTVPYWLVISCQDTSHTFYNFLSFFLWVARPKPITGLIGWLEPD